MAQATLIERCRKHRELLHVVGLRGDQEKSAVDSFNSIETTLAGVFDAHNGALASKDALSAELKEAKVTVLDLLLVNRGLKDDIARMKADYEFELEKSRRRGLAARLEAITAYYVRRIPFQLRGCSHEMI
jgi:hypothetical protein